MGRAKYTTNQKDGKGEKGKRQGKREIKIKRKRKKGNRMKWEKKKKVSTMIEP